MAPVLISSRVRRSLRNSGTPRSTSAAPRSAPDNTRNTANARHPSYPTPILPTLIHIHADTQTTTHARAVALARGRAHARTQSTRCVTHSFTHSLAHPHTFTNPRPNHPQCAAAGKKILKELVVKTDSRTCTQKKPEAKESKEKAVYRHGDGREEVTLTTTIPEHTFVLNPFPNPNRNPDADSDPNAVPNPNRHTPEPAPVHPNPIPDIGSFRREASLGRCRGMVLYYFCTIPRT